MTLEEAAQEYRDAVRACDELTAKRNPMELELVEIRSQHIEAQTRRARAEKQLLDVARQGPTT